MPWSYLVSIKASQFRVCVCVRALKYVCVYARGLACMCACILYVQS